MVMSLFTVHMLSAHGAEWTVDSSMSVRGEFNDNLTLTVSSPGSVWGTRVTPAMKFQYATETLEILLDSSVQQVNFFGNKNNQESFTNLYFPLSVNYVREKDEFGFFATFVRDNTLQSELDETGVVVDFQQRTRREGQGVWGHEITERFKLISSYTFTDVTFEEERNVGLFGFQIHTASIGGEYELTEDKKTLLNGGFLYVNHHAPDTQFFSQTIGIETGVTHQFSETLHGSVTASGRYVRIRDQTGGVQQRSNELIWLAGGSLAKKWERTNIRVEASRNLRPSGRGVLLETTQGHLSLLHEITEQLSVAMRGSIILSESAGRSSGSSSRVLTTRFWRIEPSLSWRWSEQWYTDLFYRYSQRKTKGDRSATSNNVIIQLRYDLPEFSIAHWPDFLISQKQ